MMMIAMTSAYESKYDATPLRYMSGDDDDENNDAIILIQKWCYFIQVCELREPEGGENGSKGT